MEESMEVMHVPTFVPMITNKMPLPLPPTSIPLPTMPISIAVTAAELWITAVRATPIKARRMGLVNLSSKSTMTGSFASSDMESDISASPTKVMPSPASIKPTFFAVSLLANICTMTPTKANNVKIAVTEKD